jgi:hypothetical protein
MCEIEAMPRNYWEVGLLYENEEISKIIEETKTTM